jgi:hypothetical protein
MHDGFEALREALQAAQARAGDGGHAHAA